MMTTSYPHNAGMHPQGIPHGHPMGGPGQPGQPMPPGMQHVSGPNGPISQAGPMMGMQPGMGPNAHALSHLQPQQAHMFQQQQQHQMMNPAVMQQQQRNAQQQAFMRQQQQQAMLAQQSHGGIGIGFQTPMGNMNPQQMAAIRAQQMGGQPFVNLPPHLQQLQQQQQQMQNQQQGPQQAAALAQAQHQAAQHQAQQQQQQQQQHMQQAIAMQHAQSQSSNHSQAGNQGPPPSTQPQQGPLRPPSAVGSHQGQSSPAPQPTPQQQPQQPPQQPSQAQQQQPPQSGPVLQQQAPALSQPPNVPQQPNPQAQNPAQLQQRNPNMAQQGPGQPHPQLAQAQVQAQAQANAQAQQARNMMIKQQQAQNQAQMQSGGQGTLRLMNFVDHIGRYDKNSIPEEPKEAKVLRWQAFVDKFFAETGSFVHTVYSTAAQRTKQFEIVYAALPRYFYTLFNNTECTNLQVTLDGATEKSAGTELKVTCDRAKFIYTYSNKCQVVYEGKLTAFWSNSDKMEWLQFDGQGHEQYLPRSILKFQPASPNQMNPNQSPRMKGGKQKFQQQAGLGLTEPYLLSSHLPTTGTTDYGLPHALQGYLEIYETMNNMTSLMTHYLENSNLKPTEALESWNQMMSNNAAAMSNAGQPSPAMQNPNLPPGARPNGPGQGQMFMSPAMANQLLPNGNSPAMMHTPSPASHPMVKQHSTSSHSASVNTSPSMNNKRRRSTAKIEIDDGSGEMNGAVKVKQSPRVGGNKRMKNN
ncbi:hypothetical protein ACN47E_007717 [Coniothyrium glycines]